MQHSNVVLLAIAVVCVLVQSFASPLAAGLASLLAGLRAPRLGHAPMTRRVVAH